jgi:uncharacterized protein (DUF1697 family)
MRYVAFLRGINVGGNQIVKMADVVKVFTSLGFTDVRTVLASGNVLFDAARGTEQSLNRRIEAALSAAFGIGLKVVLRSRDELQHLADGRPFARIKGIPPLKAYVTFLKAPPKGDGPLPCGAGFRIVAVTGRTVLTTVDVTALTTDLMRALEKAFGKEITTRNWNTIERVLRA